MAREIEQIEALVNSKIRGLRKSEENLKIFIPGVVEDLIHKKEDAWKGVVTLSMIEEGMQENKKFVNSKLKELRSRGKWKVVRRIEREFKPFKDPKKVIKRIYKNAAELNPWMNELIVEKEKYKSLSKEVIKNSAEYILEKRPETLSKKDRLSKHLRKRKISIKDELNILKEIQGNSSLKADQKEIVENSIKSREAKIDASNIFIKIIREHQRGKATGRFASVYGAFLQSGMPKEKAFEVAKEVIKISGKNAETGTGRIRGKKLAEKLRKGELKLLSKKTASKRRKR